MAGSMSDYLEAKLLDHVLGNTAYTAPATIYVALLTDTNTATQRDAGTVTEVTTSGTAYARQALTNNVTNWPNASGTAPTSKANGTAVVFPVATANYGTVQAIGLYDASTSGNLLAWADLAAAQVVNTGNQIDFAVSGITVTLQ